MSLRHVDRFEARRGEESLWPGVDTLPVLHRAGGMIRDPPFDCAGGLYRRGEPEHLDHLGDIPGERGGPRRLLGVSCVLTQHKAVILDRRAAA